MDRAKLKAAIERLDQQLTDLLDRAHATNDSAERAHLIEEAVLVHAKAALLRKTLEQDQ